MSADFDLEGVVVLPRHHMGSLGVSDDAYYEDAALQAQAVRQAKAKAKYATLLAQQSKIIPANPNAPSGPLPPPVYAAPTVAPTVATIAPTSQVPQMLLQMSKPIPWKTVGIVAGVVAVGGLVTWMFVKTTRGFQRRPAVAGLAGMSRGRRRRRRR